MERFLYLAFFITIGVSNSLQIEQNSPPSPVPEVEDNSRYKTLEANETLLKLLVDNKSGVSRSEVFDMLHSRDDNINHVDLPTFPQDSADVMPDPKALPDSQAEYLQAPGVKVSKDDMERMEENSERGEPVGLAAAIMVGITCMIVFGSYAALIIWRRYELKKNGLKHQLLRNEDVAETRIEVSESFEMVSSV